MTNGNYRGKKNYTPSRNIPTLFRNKSDLKKVLELVTQALRDIQEEGYNSVHPALKMDSDGFCTIEGVTSFLKEHMDYVNSTHVVELFFKDKDRKILINGDDRIKYKIVKFVKPPEKLYFGTISSLKHRMVESGIRSKTKGYVKLYDTEERAISFASKFTTDPDDVVVTLAVDTERAFSDGLKFSTYIEGEFITVQVDKKYLLTGN